MAATGQRMTAEELLALPDDGLRHELIYGELRTTPPAGDEHGWVGMNVGGPLRQHVRAYNLGRVYLAETGYLLRRDPDLVRAPDVSFVSQERIAAGGRIRGFRLGAPDLAVEVLSPSDRPGAVAAKVAMWLAYGTRLVIVVDPDERRVWLHRLGQPPQELTEADTIDGADVVPGWCLPVAELFA